MKHKCLDLAIARELGRLPCRMSADPLYPLKAPLASEFSLARVEAEVALFAGFVGAGDASDVAARRFALLEKLETKLDASAAELVALAKALDALTGA